MTILYKHELVRSGWTTVQTFMAGNHAITTHSRCTYMAIWLCTSCHLFRWHFACSQIGQTCAKRNCSRQLHCKTRQVAPILYKVSLLDTTLTLCYVLWTYLYTAVTGKRKRFCAHLNFGVMFGCFGVFLAFFLLKISFLNAKRRKQSMCYLS